MSSAVNSLSYMNGGLVVDLLKALPFPSPHQKDRTYVIVEHCTGERGPDKHS